MEKSLVIVESPNKARTINRYLGKNYVVKSSRGHIRDLPKSNSEVRGTKPKRIPANLSPEEKLKAKEKKARADHIRRMGVNPDRNWEATWIVSSEKANVVRELQQAAEKSHLIFLATDMDREGEAIAWHLQELIGGNPERYRRVVFNEITQSAIQDAFADPGHVDLNRVNAYKTRRFLDRVVGFELSPLLWKKVARGLSAGRVQSVAVRLIVEREREIRAFNVEEYWELYANLVRMGKVDNRSGDVEEPRRFKVVSYQGSAFSPKNEKEADVALSELNEEEFVVAKHEKRPTGSKPRPPFITSTLQQAASSRLGFSVSRTMRIAQRLYENGLITYMRTDSTSLSDEAVTGVRSYVNERFGALYMPDAPLTYVTKAKAAQEAHEAIRPSDVRVVSDDLKGQDESERRLYDLIWRRFVACQMTNARYESVTTTVNAGEYELKIQGRVVLFDGFTRVWSAASKSDDDQLLPSYRVGEVLHEVQIEKTQHFTKPPARYREASLVRELEERGIGRPSTYDSITSTIQERGYVSLRQRRFYAERIGELVTDRLLDNFSDLMDYEFTSRLEQDELDRIALGNKEWLEVLNTFYTGFASQLRSAEKDMQRNDPIATNISCGECGRKMLIRVAKSGAFLGCEGYELPPKERCKHTMNLSFVEEESTAANDDEESRVLRLKRKCSKCSTAMDCFLVDETRKLHICGNQDCLGYEIEEGNFSQPGYDGPTIECDRCGSEMIRRTGRFGPYFACSNEACGNTRKILKSGQVAPPRADPIPMPELECDGIDDHFVLRDGASGLFLAASKFPKNRQTRAPLVSEILPYANKLDPKFRHLLSAPVEDPQGRPTVIRFSRKSQEHYVRTDDKANPWSAFFKDGKWVEAARTKAKSGRRRQLIDIGERVAKR